MASAVRRFSARFPTKVCLLIALLAVPQLGWPSFYVVNGCLATNVMPLLQENSY